jgi:hypothetical protein
VLDPFLFFIVGLGLTSGIAAVINHAIEAPVGYEDGRGFHLGEDPNGDADSQF